MLEIVLLYFVHRRFAREARAKGRSGAWGWFGVGMWLSAEFLGIGFMDPAMFDVSTDPVALLRLSAIGLGFGFVGLVVAWMVMRNLTPLQSVGVPPTPADSGFVGYCETCGMNVKLTADQACPVHGRDTVGSIHRPLS
ncbi:MAG: hypothetical protein Q7J82_00695 [Coriobacteriia bacterium]|nr:hypothetical protein [Coriobacteriia bacterium]